MNKQSRTSSGRVVRHQAASGVAGGAAIAHLMQTCDNPVTYILLPSLPCERSLDQRLREYTLTENQPWRRLRAYVRFNLTNGRPPYPTSWREVGDILAIFERIWQVQIKMAPSIRHKGVLKSPETIL